MKAKFLLIILAQITQILISLPFAFWRVHLLPEGNPAGIEANVAYYGFGFIIYAIFNFIFLTYFFKSAHKVGNAFLLGIIPATMAVLVMEGIVHFPIFSWLDSVARADLVRQLPILFIGILVYVVTMLGAYKISVRRFEAVDL